MGNGADGSGGHAFGRPGIPPKWTWSTKEGVGTAYSSASRVWYTLSHGILNEVYFPKLDEPQIRDLEFLITDGETFFHEEKRDLETAIECIPEHGLAYRITGTDQLRRYEIEKEVIADPHEPCVLIRTKLTVDPQWQGKLQVYVLLAPHLAVGGWGNSARRDRVSGHNILVAWRESRYLALGADVGLSRTSCGYVGSSDGWRDLKDNFRMDWEFDTATDGNIAVLGQVNLPDSGEFMIGLAFGDGEHAAVTGLLQSLSVPFETHKERFGDQWRRVCCSIHALDVASGDGGRLYRTSHKLLLAHEDKIYAGAMIASASIPWGASKGDEDLGGYHLVWTRDMVHSAMGLLACGNVSTPRRALVYLACSQQDDGGFPQNFWLSGEPYWTGVQLDEVAFPIMLAWRLWQAGALEGFDPYPMVKAAAAFLIRQGPITQQERWEENSGYSPSTLAACIAALVCAASFARDRGEAHTAQFLLDYADFLEDHVDRWTVTSTGSLVPGIPRHYIRIHPIAVGDESPDENPDNGVLHVKNRPPGSQEWFPARDVVDAGFLELVRYGIRKPDDPLMTDSLQVVDAVLKVDTPYGPCWRRYNHDGYGQGDDGGPYHGWGQGRAWPLLTGERGHYELAAGRDAETHIRTIEAFSSKGGMLPEQVWDEADRPEKRLFMGRPAGSAMPLMWAHSEYIRLLRSADDGQVFDQPGIVADRYLAQQGRKDLHVWKPVRKVRKVHAGETLRVMTSRAFRLRWSADGWQTWQDADSVSSGLGMEYVDLAIPSTPGEMLCFTFYYPQADEWEGRDYTVEAIPVS